MEFNRYITDFKRLVTRFNHTHFGDSGLDMEIEFSQTQSLVNVDTDFECTGINYTCDGRSNGWLTWVGDEYMFSLSLCVVT